MQTLTIHRHVVCENITKRLLFQNIVLIYSFAKSRIFSYQKSELSEERTYTKSFKM